MVHGPSPSDRCQNTVDEQQQILNAVRLGQNHDDAERQITELLLTLKLAIHGEKSIDLPGGPSKELAILHACPTHALDR